MNEPEHIHQYIRSCRNKAAELRTQARELLLRADEHERAADEVVAHLAKLKAAEPPGPITVTVEQARAAGLVPDE